MVCGKPIYVALAQGREVRHAQLEHQFAQRMAGLPSPPASIMPTPTYTPMYFTTAPGMVAPFPQTQGGIVHPMGVPTPGTPAPFQLIPPLPVVCAGCQFLSFIRDILHAFS